MRRSAIVCILLSGTFNFFTRIYIIEIRLMILKCTPSETRNSIIL